MSKDIVITQKQFEENSVSFDSLEQLQGFVDRLIANEPETKADEKFRVTEHKINSETGASGFVTYDIVVSGTPEFKFNERHINDSTWDYPVLSKRKIAGPSWA